MRGSIRKRQGKRGVTWQATIELPRDPLTGKRRQKVLTAPTKREVEKEATQFIASIESGGFAEADASKLTLAEYLTRWIASLEGSVKPITQLRYGQLLRLHVTAHLGTVQLSKLSPVDLQTLYSTLLASGLSGTTVNNVHATLHKALKQAMRWRLLSRNVSEAVDAPRKAQPTYRVWSKEQVGAFLAVTDLDEWAALWRLALFTGMRRGEILGLHWQDLDLTEGVLAVRYSYSRSAEGGFEFGHPKSIAGRRSIALSPSLVNALGRHRVKQVEARLSLGEVYADQGLVFAGPTGGPIHPNTLTARFKALAVKAGLPAIRIHDLRHTSATLMLANGEHPKVVQERLGHSDIAMTLNRYSHVSMGMQREAADRMDDLLQSTS